MRLPRIKLRTWVLLAASPRAAGGDGLRPDLGAHFLVHPFSMGIATPIPSPPWATENLERKYVLEQDRLTARSSCRRSAKASRRRRCEDPPDEATVLRALEDVMPRRALHLSRSSATTSRSFNEKIVDRIDPPRFYPLIGPAQLHHCHWKCTVYYTETIESGYPFPVRIKRPRVQVVYIDKDHLHLFPGGEPGVQQQFTRDVTNQ